VAWPSHPELWQEDLPAAQESFTKLCQAIGESEALHVLVPTDAAARDAKKALADLNATFHAIPFGDIWLRDTAPLFLVRASASSDTRTRTPFEPPRPEGQATVRFGFNGWGRKYELPHDSEVSGAIARVAGLREYSFKLVLEGGSVEVDGEGTVLTTRQCLLNPNRNPGRSQDELERLLGEGLGTTKTLWLGDGLLNDHTDGHIDTVARFVAPGRVVCMQPSGKDDPNREALETMASDLASFTDARGRKLEVVRIPSPGRVTDEDGEVVPASYVNFYIANRAVVVPTYGTSWDSEAVRAIGELFPGRRAVGVDARAILTGGGAFHCITQQQPKAP
jgi:agmatine deiminase